MNRVALMLMLVGILNLVRITEGIRFDIDRKECLSYNVEYEGDTLHVSFVVIKADSPWHFTDDGVDLVVCIILFCFYFFCFWVFCC